MSVDADRLVDILDGIAEAFYALDRDWRIRVFNRQAEAFFGCSRDEMTGRLVWEALRVRAAPELDAALRAAMDEGAARPFAIASPARPDRWIEGRTFPLADGIGVAFQDITERRVQDEALRRREAELARVQRIAGIGGLEVDLRRGFRNRRSPEYLRLHGLPPEAAEETHEAWVQRIHPEDRERAEGEFKATVKGDAVQYVAEYRIVRPSDGEVRWIAASAEIERDAAGRALRLVGAHRDVTERKRGEERLRLLINELNHRVKNTLAIVQSIAAHAARRTDDPKAAWTAFEGRILALSRAHDILTRENWDGASLHELASQVAEPFRDGDRMTLAGHDMRLPPRAALAVAMALQELATNAAKYGALSAAGGRVDLCWSVGDGRPARLRLTWSESGGPAVEVPSRRGFGSRLIERSLAYDLNGTVALDFLPGGVVCTIEATMPHAAGQPH